MRCPRQSINFSNTIGQPRLHQTVTSLSIISNVYMYISLPETRTNIGGMFRKSKESRFVPASEMRMWKENKVAREERRPRESERERRRGRQRYQNHCERLWRTAGNRVRQWRRMATKFPTGSLLSRRRPWVSASGVREWKERKVIRDRKRISSVERRKILLAESRSVVEMPLDEWRAWQGSLNAFKSLQSLDQVSHTRRNGAGWTENVHVRVRQEIN